ncbi:TetR/AcrR family transcriptional regulator [uncultured Caulobacter sp.]|uniref:TetR/AcrR family transcriptional regulator n=1 Tax=uncultured Caulobacter sp. TaxID=158749 RepID=UPI0026042BBB|nr:TetR/AcrR family transcriptional regulator [uncultured Caulobacter sp.]
MSRTKGAKDLDHEVKRKELLEKMTLRLVARAGERVSFRDLAAAAGASPPTLRHYFGDRRAVLDAVLAECLRRGRLGLDAQRETDLPFAESIRAYARGLVNALRAEKSVRLGDVFALSLAEGLIDPAYGRPALEHIVEPTLQALEARLALHIARGEMRADADPRMAALQLVSPLLLACLHQDQLAGADLRVLDVETLINTACDVFVRAFAIAPAASPRPAGAARALAAANT